MKLIVYKGKFIAGVVLIVSFLAALFVILSPVFDGQTGLEYADNLFNELTKQSSYCIPKVAKKASEFDGQNLMVKVKTKEQSEAEGIAAVCKARGASAEIGKNAVIVNGDLGRLSTAALRDADAVFKGRDAELPAAYGCDGRAAMRYWWMVFDAERKQCIREGNSAEADFMKSVLGKGLEPAYNFVGIEPAKISERVGVVILLLVGYVVYTIWWGVGIMYIFEGLGVISSKALEKREA